MKRTVVLAAGIATLALGVYVGSRLSAQTGGADAPPPKHPETRIALVNLAGIIKKYEKALAYEAEIRKELLDYDTSVGQMKTRLQTADKEFKDPKTPQQTKDALEAEIRKLTFELQSKEQDERKKITTKQQEQIKILYHDIEQYVALLAKSKGIDLVFHYNDIPNPAEMYNPANIARKITCEGCLPVYMAQGINLTDEVAGGLNWNYQQAMKGTTGGPGH